MKVVVIGGYGVFGGRLAQLLLRDGHEVWIAGRNLQKAEKWAARHGGRPLQLDLSQGLAPIKEVAPRALVDAAGPFQTLISHLYRVARILASNTGSTTPHRSARSGVHCWYPGARPGCRSHRAPRPFWCLQLACYFLRGRGGN